MARNNRGDVALSQGDLLTAELQFSRSLELLRTLGDVANVARALYNLGAVALEQAQVGDSTVLLVESLALSQRIADDEDTAWCLIGLAAAATASGGRDRDGGRLLGLAEALLDRLEATMKPFEQRLFDRTRERLLDALGPARLEAARVEGQLLGPGDVLSLARALLAAEAGAS